MHSGLDRRLLSVALASVLALVSCTSAPTTPSPAAKEASPVAAKPAAASSPSPAAAARPPVVGGGAAQPRANPTFASIGGSAAIIVPTPSFNVAATPQPAALAPAVALQTVQPANVVQVVGTLSRIPTPMPGPAGSGAGSAAGSPAGSAATTGGTGTGTGAGGGAGAAGALLTIGAVVTSTPLVRVQPQPQPTIAFPR